MGMYVPNYSTLPIIKRLLGLENIRPTVKDDDDHTFRKKRGEKGRK